MNKLKDLYFFYFISIIFQHSDWYFVVLFLLYIFLYVRELNRILTHVANPLGFWRYLRDRAEKYANSSGLWLRGGESTCCLSASVFFSLSLCSAFSSINRAPPDPTFFALNARLRVPPIAKTNVCIRYREEILRVADRTITFVLRE